MLAIGRAAERGHANHGWLDSHHPFSFGNYYDPEHIGLFNLRLIG
jgi:redox-sensitive bicupin YhaK (pirin superfamily)